MGKKSREKQMRRLDYEGQKNLSADLRSSFEKYAFLIIELGVYLALLTPLIMLRDYFFPFIVPKTVYFRIIVDLIFIPYVFLALIHAKYRPRLNNPLTISLALFLAVVTLASIFGVNFQRSFWSVFERMTGLLTLIHLFVFFIILTSVFHERKYWERILVFSIIVAVLVCFLGWTSTETSTRGGSTLGNTSFMAGFLLFEIFFSIILFLTKGFWWKIFSASAIVLLMAGLLISIEPSRGAIGAFLIGVLLLGFFYLMHYLIFSGKPKLKKIGIILPIVLILGVFFLLQLGFVRDRIATEWISSSIYSRRVIWQMAIEAWKEKFWLGWGLENFNIPFVKYFDPELPISGDIWYDRTHNIIFDTVVVSGISGLISYLAIFAVAIIGLLRIVPKISEKRNLFFPLGVISALAAYFIQNLFVFDMISSYMMFFLTLALVSFLAFPPKKDQKSVQIPGRIHSFIAPALTALFAIIAILTIYFGNVLPAQASRYTIRGLVLPLGESMLYFQKALVISPISQFEVPEQFALRAMELARQPVKNINELKAQLAKAEEVLKRSIEKDPLNYRSRLFLGRYYNNLYEIFGDQEKLAMSENTLKEAIKYSPKNEQTYWTLGQIRLFKGDRAGAIEFFKQAVELEPKYGVSHWYLAMAYRIDKQYELAAEHIQEAEKFNYNFTGNEIDLQKAIEVFTALDDKPYLVFLLEKSVELSPQDAESWAKLADIYASFNENEKAKAAALKVLQIDPARSNQVKEFLRQIGYGDIEIPSSTPNLNGSEYKITFQGRNATPALLKVPVGSKVTWINQDTAFHKIHMEAADSSELAPGQKYEYYFNEKGEFWYVCSYHSYIKGKVIVE